MPNISDTIADEAVGYAIDLRRYTASVEKDVTAFLLKLERDIIRNLRDIDPGEPNRQHYRTARLKSLLAEVQLTIGKGYSEIREFVDQNLVELSSIDAAAARNLINNAIGVSLVSAHLNPAALQDIIGDILISGAPSSEWWSRQEAQTLNRFKDQVRLGMGQNESLKELVTRVRGKATGNRYSYRTSSGKLRYQSEFRGGIMDVTTRDAQALVLTSIQAVSEATRFGVFADNPDLVKGLQALVTLDDKTSDICISRSGNSWTLDGTPLNGTSEPFPGSPPWHWRCRSTLIPILTSFADLANVSPRKAASIRKNAPKSTQASMDGQVAGDLTYEDWLKGKPTTFQKNVLGPTKYKLWSENRITFKDLVDQRGNPLPVRELKAKYLN